MSDTNYLYVCLYTGLQTLTIFMLPNCNINYKQVYETNIELKTYNQFLSLLSAATDIPISKYKLYKRHEP